MTGGLGYLYQLNSDLPEKLKEAMMWELDTRQYCELLTEYVETDDDWIYIYEIIENMREHYFVLNELYIYLADKKVEIPPSGKIKLGGYIEGVEIIAANIMRMYDLYKEFSKKSKSPYIKSIFRDLSEDEKKLASALNHLYAKATWL